MLTYPFKIAYGITRDAVANRITARQKFIINGCAFIALAVVAAVLPSKDK